MRKILACVNERAFGTNARYEDRQGSSDVRRRRERRRLLEMSVVRRQRCERGGSPSARFVRRWRWERRRPPGFGAAALFQNDRARQFLREVGAIRGERWAWTRGRQANLPCLRIALRSPSIYTPRRGDLNDHPMHSCLSRPESLRVAAHSRGLARVAAAPAVARRLTEPPRWRLCAT